VFDTLSDIIRGDRGYPLQLSLVSAGIAALRCKYRWSPRGSLLSASLAEVDAASQLRSVLNITAWNPGFETLSLKRCALVGSGDVLDGAKRGRDIDSCSVVIRLNRIPTVGFFEDFGRRTDIVILDNNRSVQIMGNHTTSDGNIDCAEPGSGCFGSGIVYTGANGCSGAYRPWPPQQSFVGCFHENMTKFIRANMPHHPTSGWRAFVVFAAVCEQLDVYGFGGKTSSTATADGHHEWSKHPIGQEHSKESAIANGSWHRIEGNQDMRQWFKAAVGDVHMIDVHY